MQNAENLVKRLAPSYAPPDGYSDYWLVTHAEARVLIDAGHTVFYGAGLPLWCRTKSEMHESKDAVCRKLRLCEYAAPAAPAAEHPNGSYEVGSGRGVPSP